MKIKSTFHALAFLMAFLIFSMPLVVLAQQNSVQAEAITAAEQDANKDVNIPFWFGAGCILSGLFFFQEPFGYIAAPAGIVGAYFYRPTPPPSRLIGKSLEYVDAYTSAYQLKRGSTQALWASAGCLGGVLTVAAVVMGLAISAYRAK